MIKINLLGDALALAAAKKPEKAEQQAEQQVYVQEEGAGRASIPIAGLVVCLAFCSMGLMYYLYLSRQVEQAEKRKVDLETQKKALEKYNLLYKQYQDQKDTLKKKLDVIKKVKLKQESTVQVIEQLANCVPDDIWFDEVYVNGKSVTVVGNGGTFEAINIFRSKLADNKKWFTKVNHQGSTKVSAQAVSFTITFELVEDPS
jgi:Tfp pilus assembly protein PilN